MNGQSDQLEVILAWVLANRSAHNGVAICDFTGINSETVALDSHPMVVASSLFRRANQLGRLLELMAAIARWKQLE